MDSDVVGLIITGIVIFMIMFLGVLYNNYMENRQCEILQEGGTETAIRSFFIVQDTCYVRVNGKLIDANNYRGLVD